MRSFYCNVSLYPKRKKLWIGELINLGNWILFVIWYLVLGNVEVIIKEWIETAEEFGRPIPTPKGKLMYA